MRLLRLFNEPAGREGAARPRRRHDLVNQLPLLGISAICNLLAAIKSAKSLRAGGDDVVVSCFTDSMELYQSRLAELTAERGDVHRAPGRIDFERYLLGATTDHLKELTYPDRKAIHNLKYFTWVEQQGKTVAELNALWSPSFWTDLQAQLPAWDEAIEAFNEETGVRGPGSVVREETRQ